MAIRLLQKWQNSAERHSHHYDSLAAFINVSTGTLNKHNKKKSLFHFPSVRHLENGKKIKAYLSSVAVYNRACGHLKDVHMLRPTASQNL